MHAYSYFFFQKNFKSYENELKEYFLDLMK